MDYLEMKTLFKFDSSVEKPLKSADGESDRVLFELPFCVSGTLVQYPLCMMSSVPSFVHGTIHYLM